jgi:methyl-accepting chemotaxis protein
MVKRTITLTEAVGLKKKLEIARNEVNEEIRVLMEEKTVDTDKVEILESKCDNIVDLILDLHEKIQEANLNKGKGETNSNAKNIKLLSELNTKRGYRASFNVKGKELTEQIKKNLKGIDEEMEKISSKLSKFNVSQKIKIIIPDSLIEKKDDDTYVAGIYLS